MKGSHKKALVAGIVLSGAVGYLLWAGVSAGKSYYLDVDTFLANPEFQGQQVSLRGVVDPDNLNRDVAPRTIAFQLRGKDKKLPVRFKGTVPDLFGPDREVVVEGRLDKDRVFQASKLLTKCASKYEGDNMKGGKK